jgi:hypothetical protein
MRRDDGGMPCRPAAHRAARESCPPLSRPSRSSTGGPDLAVAEVEGTPADAAQFGVPGTARRELRHDRSTSRRDPSPPALVKPAYAALAHSKLGGDLLDRQLLVVPQAPNLGRLAQCLRPNGAIDHLGRLEQRQDLVGLEPPDADLAGRRPRATAALPEEEQMQVYADYQGINQTPGVTPGLPSGLRGSSSRPGWTASSRSGNANPRVHRHGRDANPTCARNIR